MNRVFYARVLFMSRASWTVFGVLTVLAASAAYLPGDRPIAHWVQSISRDPVAVTFPWISASLATVLVLTVGIRSFNRVLLAIGAAVGVFVVAVVGIERIYVGAHYPSDVLGGILLAVSVLSLALSVRWIGAPVVERLGVVGAGHGNH